VDLRGHGGIRLGPLGLTIGMGFRLPGYRRAKAVGSAMDSGAALVWTSDLEPNWASRGRRLSLKPGKVRTRRHPSERRFALRALEGLHFRATKWLANFGAMAQKVLSETTAIRRSGDDGPGTNGKCESSAEKSSIRGTQPPRSTVP